MKIVINTCIYMLLGALALNAQTPPPGFVPPALHPEGAELVTEQLSDGVYALISTNPPVDNAGFVVGDRGVLVIDAHIDERMAQQIQDAVRAVTDKPLLYLINTNYHADHTFGNHAFPASTRVVAHRDTETIMRGFEEQKKRMRVTVRNDPSVFAGAKLRLPDIVFEQYLRLDLGGRVVELYHFGTGNTSGDTVVYVPDAKTAWTGNLVLGEGSLPFLLAGDPAGFATTLSRFNEALAVETLVPGHGQITSGAILGRYLDYLQSLVHAVRAAHRRGWTLEETLELTPLWDRFKVPPDLPSEAFYTGLHPFNLQRAYLELDPKE